MDWQCLGSYGRGKLVWVQDIECFAVYDGRRWSLERGGIEAQRLAHDVIAHVRKEVQALSKPPCWAASSQPIALAPCSTGPISASAGKPP
jgi:hypothetical protein